ncbi:MAG: preprotein translocase subunit SecE [Synergistaceae bacterium]|jgi:preprotein translocase subunit SecE|nr:preprotein translocase subunit SecE [Synergistaceae bacterium]
MAKEPARSIPRLTAWLTFFREAKAELKKVTWPGKTQIWYSTLIVIAFTLCVSLYLGVVDFLLTWVFSTILG